MGIKKIKLLEDVPLVEGKTYMTKFATKEMFTVTKIILDKTGRQVSTKGIYEKCPDLGECPLGVDRLIHEKIEVGESEVCDCCSHPILSKFKGKRFDSF